MRYKLAGHEWIAIKPMLPNKPRGLPPVNDRRVLNGIFPGSAHSPILDDAPTFRPFCLPYVVKPASRRCKNLC